MTNGPNFTDHSYSRLVTFPHQEKRRIDSTSWNHKFLRSQWPIRSIERLYSLEKVESNRKVFGWNVCDITWGKYRLMENKFSLSFPLFILLYLETHCYGEMYIYIYIFSTNYLRCNSPLVKCKPSISPSRLSLIYRFSNTLIPFSLSVFEVLYNFHFFLSYFN